MNGFYGGAFRKVGDAECATAASPELGQAEFSPKSTQAAATASRGHSGAVEGTPRPRTTARSRLHAAGRRPPAAAAMPPAADSAEAAAAHRQRKPAVHQPPAGRGKPATAAAGQGRPGTEQRVVGGWGGAWPQPRPRRPLAILGQARSWRRSLHAPGPQDGERRPAAAPCPGDRARCTRSGAAHGPRAARSGDGITRSEPSHPRSGSPRPTSSPSTIATTG